MILSWETARYCIDCGARLSDASNDPKRCKSCNSTARYRGHYNRLLDATLNKTLCWQLGLSTTMCKRYGTRACGWCEYRDHLPKDCPPLNGHPEIHCSECKVPCRCNGKEKEDADK